MSELGAALRQFADAIDAGTILPDASMCALVIADDEGATKVTFIGKLRPAEPACIVLLARGIERMALRTQEIAALGTSSGSTH